MKNKNRVETILHRHTGHMKGSVVLTHLPLIVGQTCRV